MYVRRTPPCTLLSTRVQDVTRLWDTWNFVHFHVGFLRKRGQNSGCTCTGPGNRVVEGKLL